MAQGTIDRKAGGADGSARLSRRAGVAAAVAFLPLMLVGASWLAPEDDSAKRAAAWRKKVAALELRSERTAEQRYRKEVWTLARCLEGLSRPPAR